LTTGKDVDLVVGWSVDWAIGRTVD